MPSPSAAVEERAAAARLAAVDGISPATRQDRESQAAAYGRWFDQQGLPDECRWAPETVGAWVDARWAAGVASGTIRKNLVALGSAAGREGVSLDLTHPRAVLKGLARRDGDARGSQQTPALTPDQEQQVLSACWEPFTKDAQRRLAWDVLRRAVTDAVPLPPHRKSWRGGSPAVRMSGLAAEGLSFTGDGTQVTVTLDDGEQVMVRRAGPALVNDPVRCAELLAEARPAGPLMTPDDPVDRSFSTRYIWSASGAYRLALHDATFIAVKLGTAGRWPVLAGMNLEQLEAVGTDTEPAFVYWYDRAKAGPGERGLRVTGEAARLLAEWVDLAAWYGRTTGPVFRRSNIKQQGAQPETNRASITNLVARLSAATGIPFTQNSLRRTAATRSYHDADGRSVEATCALLDHDGFQHTDTYIATGPEAPYVAGKFVPKGWADTPFDEMAVEAAEAARLGTQLAVATERKYVRRIDGWERWCDEHGEEPWPVDGTLAARHVAGLSHGSARATVEALNWFCRGEDPDWDRSRLAEARAVAEGLARLAAAERTVGVPTGLGVSDLVALAEATGAAALTGWIARRDRLALALLFAGALHAGDFSLGFQTGDVTEDTEGLWLCLPDGQRLLLTRLDPLHPLLDVREAFRAVHGDDPAPGPLLPVRATSDRDLSRGLSTRAMAKRMGLWCVAAGLDATPGDVRRAWAVCAHEQGLDLLTIHRHLRHTVFGATVDWLAPLLALDGTNPGHTIPAGFEAA